MCLLFVVRNCVAGSPLVVAFNRDESYDRPTAPAAQWPDAPWVLAGRDLVRGGTWGGITLSGRMAFITFIRRREPRKADPPPRGEIAAAYLRTYCEPLRYLETLRTMRREHLGYNLVLGTVGELFHYDNVTDCITPIEDGIHGVSNALFNTPWPKVVRGKEAIAEMIAQRRFSEDELFRLVSDEARAERSELPTDTGMSEEKEWCRSSIFVRAPSYGTRSSTVIRFYANGAIRFQERSYGVDRERTSTVVQECGECDSRTRLHP